MRNYARLTFTRWTLTFVFVGTLALACNEDDVNEDDAGGRAGASDDASAGVASGTAGSGTSAGGEGGGSAATGSSGAAAGAAVVQGGFNSGGSPNGHGGVASGGDGTAGEDDPGGGAGGAGGANSCVQQQVLGKYALNVHSFARTCFNADFSCGPETAVQDLTGTFEIWTSREAPWGVFGKLNVPGLMLDEVKTGTETWDIPLSFYYPKPGENVDIWSNFFPEGATWGEWYAPAATGSWVRVMADICPDEQGNWGFVHIDVELATGRVLDFARKCDVEYDTLWEEYRARGGGDLACDLPACNETENTAPNASLVKVSQPDAMTGGPLSAGRYHLTSVRYGVEEPCDPDPMPSSLRETLEIVPSSATEGVLQFVSERGSAQPVRFSEGYNHAATGMNLTTYHLCGTESFEQREVRYSASSTELALSFLNVDCDDNGWVTYVYAKQ
jgi:hypothetical protein